MWFDSGKKRLGPILWIAKRVELWKNRRIKAWIVWFSAYMKKWVSRWSVQFFRTKNPKIVEIWGFFLKIFGRRSLESLLESLDSGFNTKQDFVQGFSYLVWNPKNEKMESHQLAISPWALDLLTKSTKAYPSFWNRSEIHSRYSLILWSLIAKKQSIA